MDIECYLDNINSLEKALGLKSPICLDDDLSCTFISHHSKPLLISIQYSMLEEKITIKTVISSHFPKSRLGIQTIMNKLVGDLLTQKLEIGRLTANLDENSISFVKQIGLEQSLGDFIPLFINEALKWRAKFESSLLTNAFSAPSSKPREIISFESF